MCAYQCCDLPSHGKTSAVFAGSGQYKLSFWSEVKLSLVKFFGSQRCQAPLQADRIYEIPCCSCCSQGILRNQTAVLSVTFCQLRLLTRDYTYPYTDYTRININTRASPPSTRAAHETNAHRHLENILDWLMSVPHFLKLPDLHLPRPLCRPPTKHHVYNVRLSWYLRVLLDSRYLTVALHTAGCH
jgi:hypothetical protein